MAAVRQKPKMHNTGQLGPNFPTVKWLTCSPRSKIFYYERNGGLEGSKCVSAVLGFSKIITTDSTTTRFTR
jgi:hypothetical protein